MFKLDQASTNKKTSIQRKIDSLFSIGPQAHLTNLAAVFSQYIKSIPATQSQKGPGNTKIYAIGQHNFITKTYEILAKSKEWLDRLLRNGYNQHSKYLKYLQSNQAAQIKFDTKLSTIFDEDYSTSVADKEVSPVEEFVNRLLTIWSGKHNIPNLANKRLAGELEGLPMLADDIILPDGTINEKVTDTFVGYLADELLAISDAKYTRKFFISELNRVLGLTGTGREYTIDSFSDLNSYEQEAIFLTNPEAAKLLKYLKNTYHYRATKPILFMHDGRLVKRSFHIDLRKGNGYKPRHFSQLLSKVTLTDQQIDTLSKDQYDSSTRDTAGRLAYTIVNKQSIRNGVERMLKYNVSKAIQRLGDLGAVMYDGDEVSNIYLPENAIKQYINGKESDDNKEVSPSDTYRAIGGATIQIMSDILEFEKTCHGDMAYHKNAAAQEKRYSGIASTVSLTSEKGTISNVFTEDTLYDSETYNVVSVNTTFVANAAKFIGEMMRNIGLGQDDVEFKIDDDSFAANIDYKLLLDENG
jgi:hypothetical protein